MFQTIIRYPIISTSTTKTALLPISCPLPWATRASFRWEMTLRISTTTATTTCSRSICCLKTMHVRNCFWHLIILLNLSKMYEVAFIINTCGTCSTSTTETALFQKSDNWLAYPIPTGLGLPFWLTTTMTAGKTFL